MPTNDERREVAARLRNTLLTEGASQYMMEHDCDEPYAVAEVVFRNLRHLLGFNETYSVHDVANRLADLIEPEPERTCRNVSKSTYSDEFDCSECGLNLDLIGSECGCGSTMAFFEGRKMVRELKEPNYCPNCGCRVKEE